MRLGGYTYSLLVEINRLIVFVCCGENIRFYFSLGGVVLRKKFLVRGEVDESKLRKILDPILLGIVRTTHKVMYRTSEGVVEYFSMSLGSGLVKYVDVGVSEVLRKIMLWNRGSVDVLERMLRSEGIEMVEILREGARVLELKA